MKIFVTTIIIGISALFFSFSFNHNANNKVSLGKMLFNEKLLSKDSSISCASCHNPSLAFADTLPFSIGIHGKLTKRNTPSVLNMKNRPYYFWDGRAGNLADMVMMPVQNPIEMNITDLNALCNKLNQISYYKNLFSGTLGTNSITPYGIQIGRAHV